MLDPKIYPGAKFISEFGFQSWPSWQLYRQVTERADWSPHSDMSEFRCAHRTASCWYQGSVLVAYLFVAGNVAAMTLGTMNAAGSYFKTLHHGRWVISASLHADVVALGARRMRHPNGIAELEAQLARHFRLPQQMPGGFAEAFQKFIYLTQVLHKCFTYPCQPLVCIGQCAA